MKRMLAVVQTRSLRSRINGIIQGDNARKTRVRAVSSGEAIPLIKRSVEECSIGSFSSSFQKHKYPNANRHQNTQDNRPTHT